MAVRVNAAGSVYLNRLVLRRLIEFRVTCLRRVRSFRDPHQALVSASDSRYPEAAVLRVYSDRISPKSNPVITSGIDRFSRLGPSQIDLAISISVDDT